MLKEKLNRVFRAGWNNFRSMIIGYEVRDVPASEPTRE